MNLISAITNLDLSAISEIMRDNRFIPDNTIVNHAIKFSNLEVINLLFRYSVPVADNAIWLSIVVNKLDITYYLLENSCEITEEAITAAIRKNNFDLFYSLRKRIPFIGEEASIAAVGNAEIIQHLLNNGDPISSQSLINAIEIGNNEIAELLINHYVTIDAVETFHDEIFTEERKYINTGILNNSYKSLPTLYYPVPKRIYNKKSPISIAAKYGHIWILRALLNNGFQIRDDAVVLAVKNGQIEIVKLLLSYQINIIDGLIAAAKYNRQDLFEIILLHVGSLSHNKSLSSEILNCAILNNNFEMIQLLYEYSAEYDENTICYALHMNNIYILRYLLENLPVTDNHLEYVASYSSLQTVKLLLLKYKGKLSNTYAVEYAIINNQQEVKDLLLRFEVLQTNPKDNSNEILSLLIS